jgi:hypothetical protein
MEDDEGNLFKVPFSNGIACCLMLNGNLLVYNVQEKTFVEVDEHDGVQREIKNEKHIKQQAIPLLNGTLNKFPSSSSIVSLTILAEVSDHNNTVSSGFLSSLAF